MGILAGHAREVGPMRRTIGACGPLLALLAIAGVARGQEPPATPSQRYEALLEESRKPVGAPPTSDEERTKYIGRGFRRRSELALKFVELAEQNPKDPIALDALIQAVWNVNSTPWPFELVGPDEAPARALALIERDHLKSEKLGPLCQRVSYGFREEYEKFLRAVDASDGERAVKGIASLSLAHLLSNRAQRIETIRAQERRVADFEALFGRDYVRKLVAQDFEREMAQAGALLEEAAAKYGDVKVPDSVTVGERAAAELFEVRHLRVGREAPDVEGDDQDGRRFKLSDYRGKVVLLDFWHQQ
jgi:AhpC/TSA family protein